MIPDKEYGSGFFVDAGKPDKCIVATDDHVVHAFPEVTLDDGASYDAHRIKTNPENEMTYLELQNVPHPKQQCKPSKLASGDLYPLDSDVMVIDKHNDIPNALPGTVESSQIVSTAFSHGFFSAPTKLQTARYLVPGAGPGTSGMTIYDRNGDVKSVMAGGHKNYAFGKPIGSISDDVEDLKSEFLDDKSQDQTLYRLASQKYHSANLASSALALLGKTLKVGRQ